MTTTPAAYDTITSPEVSLRIEHITAGEAYLVGGYGDRWSVPVDQLVLARAGVRGGAPAEWDISSEWTA